VPETDDGRYDRGFWLKLIERAQDEASGKIQQSRILQLHAQRWLTSCSRKRTRRACLQCTQLLRLGELAGLSETQVYNLSERENEKYGENT
jgi:hypothetical protein